MASDPADQIPVPDFDIVVPSSPQLVYETLGNDDCGQVCRSRGYQIDVSDPLRCTRNSAVYAASQSKSGKPSALKVSSYKKRLAHEFENRRSLPESPFLVESVSFFEDSDHAVLEMELCDGDIRTRQFTEQDLWILVHDIGTALSVIHSHNFMHLDVSPGNILLNEGPMFKLADFGTMLPVGEFDVGCEGAGPYVSPESLEFPDGPHSVGTASDIFSFGLVLLEAATGVAAPRGGTPNYRALRRGEIKLGEGAYTCDLSPEFVQLVNQMIDVTPSRRPTADQISKCMWAQRSVCGRDRDEYSSF